MTWGSHRNPIGITKDSHTNPIGIQYEAHRRPMGIPEGFFRHPYSRHPTGILWESQGDPIDKLMVAAPAADPCGKQSARGPRREPGAPGEKCACVVLRLRTHCSCLRMLGLEGGGGIRLFPLASHFCKYNRVPFHIAACGVWSKAMARHFYAFLFSRCGKRRGY